jgi:GNAT superfamily N-acetyltransferase
MVTIRADGLSLVFPASWLRGVEPNIVSQSIDAFGMTISIKTFTGLAIGRRLPILARLCTTVFHEWPHLYDGDGSYGTEHLQTLINNPRAMLIIAYDGDVAVGASTCLPLTDATVNVRAPFDARGWLLPRFFYLAESVLLPEYRGRGIGKIFFVLRENHARCVSNCDFTCFCAVQRPQDHPARPADTVPLDTFWRGLGYQARSDLHCEMAWREVGQTEATRVTLGFWVKSLTATVLT